MWVIVVIIVIVVIVKMSNSGEQSTPSSPPAVPRTSDTPTRFQVRGRLGHKDFEGDPIPMLNIQVRGPVSVSHSNYPTRIRCELADVTDPEPMPILCMIEALQAPDTIMFHYDNEGPTLPYSESIMEEWVNWLSLPHEFFVFPRNGERKLQVTIRICDSTGQRSVASAKTTVSMVVKEKGYQQKVEERKRVKELTLRLAMAVSAADGDLATSESALIKSWVHSRTEQADGSRDEEEVTVLNGVIRKAYADLVDGEGIKLHSLCKELAKTGSLAETYDALELCVRLAGADDIAQAEEMDLLHSVAQWLGIKDEKLRSFVDKHLPVTIHAVQDVHRLLGLRDNMSIDEKKKALRKAYRHWNSMAAHADPDKRKQAAEMLELIAEERAKLS